MRQLIFPRGQILSKAVNLRNVPKQQQKKKKQKKKQKKFLAKIYKVA